MFETINNDTTLLTIGSFGFTTVCFGFVYHSSNTIQNYQPTHRQPPNTQTTTQTTNQHVGNRPPPKQPPNTQTTTQHTDNHPTPRQPPNTQITTQHTINHPAHRQPPNTQTTTQHVDNRPTHRQPLNTSLVRWSVACAPPLYMCSGYFAARDRRIPYES
jgi:hypothetical protein